MSDTTENTNDRHGFNQIACTDTEGSMIVSQTYEDCLGCGKVHPRGEHTKSSERAHAQIAALQTDEFWERAEGRLANSRYGKLHRITRPMRDAIMLELHGVGGSLTEARDSIDPSWRKRTSHDAGSFYCVVGGPGHPGECSGFWAEAALSAPVTPEDAR